MSDEYFEPFIKLGEVVQKELEDLGLVLVQFVPLPNFRHGPHHIQVVLEVDPERLERIMSGEEEPGEEETKSPAQLAEDQKFFEIVMGDKEWSLEQERNQTADDLRSIRDSLAEDDVKKNLDEGDGIL